MASTTDVTLATLIEDTLNILMRTGERPLLVTVDAANPLDDDADTSVDVTDASDLSVHDRLEWGTEISVITAISSNTLTLARAQYGTTADTAGQAAGAQAVVNPTWERHLVQRTLERYLQSSLPAALPFRDVVKSSRTTDKGWVELDAAVMQVFELYLIDSQGEKDNIDQFEFQPTWPTDLATSGKVCKVPTWVADDTDLYLLVEKPYQWYATGGTTARDPNAPTAETDVVRLLHGSDELPSLYAAAYLVTGRELTRLELDAVDEWNQEAALRQGISIRIVREFWMQYHERLQDQKAQHWMRKGRPFVRRKRHRQSVSY
jgi:hypothetical protein